MTPNDPGLTPNESDTESEEKITKYQCEYCDKYLSKNSHLHRHYKRCKEKAKIDDKKMLQNQIKDLYDQLHAKDEQIHELIGKVGDTHQTIINLNIYGKENLDYLTPKYFQKLLKGGAYGAIPKLIKHIHCNPEHPENHNIKITNKKQPFVSVWEEEKWVIKDKKEVLENMVDKGYNLIDDYYDDEGKEILDNKKIKIYNKFQNDYDKNKNVKKKVNKDIELVILNK